MQKILSSAQDYLEAILELSENSSNVKSVDVAKKLDVSRASVNRAVNVLKEQGYIKISGGYSRRQPRDRRNRRLQNRTLPER